jgi:hypothetical protein
MGLLLPGRLGNSTASVGAGDLTGALPPAEGALAGDGLG